MSDNFWQAGSLLSLINLRTGVVETCQRGVGLKAELLEFHPTSGAPVVGFELPYWEETLQVAVDAHAVFPEFGVCGYDIAVAPDGPRILECNDNPDACALSIRVWPGYLERGLCADLERRH